MATVGVPYTSLFVTMEMKTLYYVWYSSKRLSRKLGVPLNTQAAQPELLSNFYRGSCLNGSYATDK